MHTLFHFLIFKRPLPTQQRSKTNQHRVNKKRNVYHAAYFFMSVMMLSGCELTDEKPSSSKTLANSNHADIADKEESSDNISHSGLWQRLRNGYQLPSVSDLENTLGTTQQVVFKQRISPIIRRYQAHPDSLVRQMNNAQWYLHYIVEAVEKQNMPLELALLPFVESGFDPFAYSSGRASGLWQFIPITAQRFSLERNWWLDERRDIKASTQAAITYLNYLYNHLGNDWLLALAAYNAGEGTVGRAVKRNKKLGKPVDFWSLKLPKKTRFYVPKLLAWADIIRHPEKYNVTLPKLMNQPVFATIDVESQIDLAKMAEITNIDIDTLYQLNPAYNRWATDPKPPHQLLIPYEKLASAKIALAEYPSEKRISWKQHTVKPNESLSVIAQRYKTTIRHIQTANRLSSSVIHVGKTLLIPIASKNSSYYKGSQQQRLASRQNTPTSSSRNNQKIIYQVKTGDTLWGIAKKFNVRASSIARWNNMSTKDLLRNKQSLALWLPKNSAKPKENNLEKAHIKQRKVTYRVRKGDNLSNISNKFNVSVSDLQQWNSLSSKKYLQPNQILRLFIDVSDTSRPFN